MRVREELQELTERYREDPVGTVAWWEHEQANRILNCTTDEKSTWLAFTDEDRSGLTLTGDFDGNKALIYAHLTEMLQPTASKNFPVPGRKGYVANGRVRDKGGRNLPAAPPGTRPWARTISRSTLAS